MTAFVSFLRVYAIWIYLLLLLGILFGIKGLVDARRLSRTTLFSLDQERAVEQSFRAIILILFFLLAMFFVTGVNLVVAPVAPTPESPIPRALTVTLAPIFFSTNTPVPTPTPTRLPASPTRAQTATPLVPTPTRTATKPPAPAQTPGTASPFPFPAPVIVGPVPNGGTWIGEGQANAAITFRWTCEPCALGANDWYEVVITFTERTGGTRTVAGRTQDKFLSLRRLLDGGAYEIYQKAKEDEFQWYVQIKREPGNQPLSPPSQTWKFVWK